MTYLDAIVDSLVPGDETLPSGTAAGVRLDPGPHRTLLDAIARAAGGEEAFMAADVAGRTTAIGEVEHTMPAELAALIFAVVEDYYDSDAVITAFGWTPEPPQPNGHPLPAFDEALLANVKRRAPMWRNAPTRR